MGATRRGGNRDAITLMGGHRRGRGHGAALSCLPRLPRLTCLGSDLLSWLFRVYFYAWVARKAMAMEYAELIRRLKILIITFATYLALC